MAINIKDTITKIGVRNLETGGYDMKDIGVSINNIDGIDIPPIENQGNKFLAANGKWKSVTVDGDIPFLVNGKIPENYLPSYIDDVLEGYYNSTNQKFYKTYENETYGDEITGEEGKIYLSLDNNNIYRWSGSTFVKINSGSDGNFVSIGNSNIAILSNNIIKTTGINTSIPSDTYDYSWFGDTTNLYGGLNLCGPRLNEFTDTDWDDDTIFMDLYAHISNTGIDLYRADKGFIDNPNNPVAVEGERRDEYWDRILYPEYSTGETDMKVHIGYFTLMGYLGGSTGDKSIYQHPLEMEAGWGSTNLGQGVLASGRYSVAQGYHTKTGQDYQVAIGQYNNNKNNTLFEIGNGTYRTNSNAFEVYEDGHINVNGDIYQNGSIYHDSTKANVDDLGDLAYLNKDSNNSTKYLRGDGTWQTMADGVTGVKGDAESSYRTGNVNITKANIGLGNVDNTSDASKPVSTATQTALDGKVPNTRTVNGHALSSDVSVTASDVGLGKVPNVTTNNQTPTFNEASTRANINSGETVATLFGKIKKWFSDLGDLAFLNKDGASSTKFLCGDGTWQSISGGIIIPVSIANGGTGNSDGYIRTGQKSGTTIGSSATAEGSDTEASGIGSHAEGEGTIASGRESHAEGGGTIASQIGSHAEGVFTKASGLYSHAEGMNTIASQQSCHAEGTYTTASGSCSHAGGFHTIAGYSDQTAIGRYNDNKSTTLFEVGNGTVISSVIRSNAFEVHSNGNVIAASYNSSGADYAEMFEWEDKNINNEDRIGKFVKLNGNKISFAENNDEDILGIVSGNPSISGDACNSHWNKMYLTDIYGRYIYEEVEIENQEENEETTTETKIEKRLKINPEYDATQVYIPRSERPEWDYVGLLGKLVLIDDGTNEINGYAKSSNQGIATKSETKTKFRVLERLDETHIRVLIL